MRRFGLIGRPLGHSASAAYFAAKFEREGIADCTYTLYELPEIGALERLLAETPDLCGFNVTIPYKREVMALLDDLSYDARLVGAVNCVRRTAGGRLVGHNTDVIGLRAAFDCLLGGEQPSHALVLGTGGASQAVQYVLAERGIPFDLVSRDAAKGNYTYDNLPCEADFKGLKLRVSNDPVMNGMVESLGANPTVVSFGELYSALQTGVVDGAEQTIANYKSNAFPEVANNLILDGHTLGAIQAVITDNAWGKLTENQQAAIMEAGADTQAFNADLSETAENKVLEEL